MGRSLLSGSRELPRMLITGIWSLRCWLRVWRLPKTKDGVRLRLSVLLCCDLTFLRADGGAMAWQVRLYLLAHVVASDLIDCSLVPQCRRELDQDCPLAFLACLRAYFYMLATLFYLSGPLHTHSLRHGLLFIYFITSQILCTCCDEKLSRFLI